MTSKPMVFLKKLMKAVQTWVQLPILEKSLTIEAWIDFLIVALLLRTPFQRRIMQQNPLTRQQHSQIQPAPIIALVDAVALFHIKKMTCLERALVAQRVLRRRGTDVTLRIGVSHLMGQFEAHAWLEQNGKIFDESAGQFSVLRKPSA